MATLTATLETLRGRRARGERPAVSVGGPEYEFAGVMFGGTSPLVTLVSPVGARASRTAAEWKRLGATFRGRSRDLNKASRMLPRSPRVLEQEIRQVTSDVGAEPDAFDLRRFAVDVNAELPYVLDESGSEILARGRVGKKVFISALWRMLRRHPRIGRMTEQEFKRHLYEAHRAQLVELSRADFVQAMDPAEVSASEVITDGARFHFVGER